MASIQKKVLKDTVKYYIVENFRDEDGKRRVYWIPCKSRAEANDLLPEVQAAEQAKRKYVRPRYAMKDPLHYASSVGQKYLTVKELVTLYVKRHCAEGGWEARTAAANEGLLNNYVYPVIGDEPITNITTFYMQQYYDDLQTMDAVKPKHGETAKISPRTVRDINKILHPAFAHAVRSGLLTVNPTDGVKLPKLEKFKRKQWSMEEVLEGLQACQEPELLLMISMMYACTMRSGELLGTRWESVELPEDGSVGKLVIENALARLRKDMIEETKTEIHFMFPNIKDDATTTLVLKAPKTDGSNRTNYISPSIVQMLHFQKRKQEQWKALLGSEFQDYGLVFCQPNGRPITSNVLTDRFKAYLDISSMKEIEFYSLRHSGATSQMDVSGNDIKAVQENMGHASSDMLMNVYLAPVEQKRRDIALKLEEKVFSQLDWEWLFGKESDSQNKK